MINHIKIIALTILITCVLIASVSDIKTLTISNRLTFLMSISGLTLGSLFYLDNIICLLLYYLSVVLIFILSYILWHFGLWAGGDVKLLTAVSTLLCADYMDIMPSFYLAGNLFPYNIESLINPTVHVIINSIFSIIPIIIFFVIYEIIRNKTYLIKDIVKKYDLINIIITLNSLSIYYLINEIIHIDNIIINIIILLVISFLLNKLSSRVHLPTHIFSLIIISTYTNNIQLIIMEFILLICAVIIKNMIKYNLLKKVLSYPVNISQLKESMIPAYELIKINDNYLFDKRSLKEKLTDKEKYEVIIGQKAHGLTKDDIKLLNKLNKTNNIDDDIPIKHSVAFAPFILCGVIITLLLGNTTMLIKELIGVII